MAKKQQLWAKIGLLLFLAMIIIGFTVPGFINNIDAQDLKPVEPRLCQTDAQCYLTCNDQPLAVLCTKNICSQNGCHEPTYYPLKDVPLTFSLIIETNGQKISFINRSKSEDFFVKYDHHQVKLFAVGLNLNQVMEKVNMRLSATCLHIATESYCSTGQHTLKILANGNETYAGGDFIPLEGDQINIVYS